MVVGLVTWFEFLVSVLVVFILVFSCSDLFWGLLAGGALLACCVQVQLVFRVTLPDAFVILVVFIQLSCSCLWHIMIAISCFCLELLFFVFSLL